jgi:hypothetical protein
MSRYLKFFLFALLISSASGSLNSQDASTDASIEVESGKIIVKSELKFLHISADTLATTEYAKILDKRGMKLGPITPEDKLDAIFQVCIENPADIYHITEVSSKEMVLKLKNALNEHFDLDIPYRFHMPSYKQVHNNVFITWLDVLSITAVDKGTKRSIVSLMQFPYTKEKIIVAGVHLKAIKTFPMSEKLSGIANQVQEMQAVKDIVTSMREKEPEEPYIPVVVLGDFNSYDRKYELVHNRRKMSKRTTLPTDVAHLLLKKSDRMTRIEPKVPRKTSPCGTIEHIYFSKGPFSAKWPNLVRGHCSADKSQIVIVPEAASDHRTVTYATIFVNIEITPEESEESEEPEETSVSTVHEAVKPKSCRMEVTTAENSTADSTTAETLGA